MAPELIHARWRKSTYSGDSGDCVEVAGSDLDVVPVRDSKNVHGPYLHVSTRAWRTFISSVRAEEFPAPG
ncbi:DUF397 domain-containing protein [Streptomyces mobaraensis]|uniref:DUF397 domain-containing protein n=1 Tax=Streptomyces mobaraensis TaxID=35621 RepID=UPI0033332655